MWFVVEGLQVCERVARPQRPLLQADRQRRRQVAAAAGRVCGIVAGAGARPAGAAPAAQAAAVGLGQRMRLAPGDAACVPLRRHCCPPALCMRHLPMQLRLKAISWLGRASPLSTVSVTTSFCRQLSALAFAPWWCGGGARVERTQHMRHAAARHGMHPTWLPFLTHASSLLDDKMSTASARRLALLHRSSKTRAAAPGALPAAPIRFLAHNAAVWRILRAWCCSSRPSWCAASRPSRGLRWCAQFKAPLLVKTRLQATGAAGKPPAAL